MTNKEALQANINFPLKDASIEFALTNVGLNGADVYTSDNLQKVETALAGLLLILATSPKSVSELDYSLSSQDVADILELRSIYLKRYDLPDETLGQAPTISDATAFWGTTNYDC
jgi:hypothetical protein